MPKSLTHLERLEAEAIHIMREVVAKAERPDMRSAGAKAMAVVRGEADIYLHIGGQFE